MEDAARSFKALGAFVIISSQTPGNPFRYHTETTPVYALYAKAVAEKTGVAFVDHFSLTRDEYLSLGAAAVNKMLPSDGIHTTLAGAEVAARSFIKGVLCAGQLNPLYPYVSADARLVSPFAAKFVEIPTDFLPWRAQEILRRKGGALCKGSLSLNL
jgi:rhamnogalacturonan acetylesterase